tara:strand:- start:56 stop:856 length:801 start_codon:yes stop_codon:yes gene_type:complete
MTEESLFNLVALIGFAPLIVVSLRTEATTRAVMFALLGATAAGVSSTFIHHIESGWRADLGNALLATVASTLVLAAAISLFRPLMNRYLFLLVPYLFVLCCLGIALAGTSPISASYHATDISVPVHIGFSLATYAMLTLAAMAALGATLKERALKLRRSGSLASRLPAVADSESFLILLLTGAEVLLLAGLMTGSILSFDRAGVAFPLDHKTLLSVLAFLVIGALIILHRSVGMRGKLAARLVLIAWILLTLGYPGVKFVTELLLI